MKIQLESKLKIVDIGAAINEDEPWEILCNAGIAHVVGFEPNKDEIKKLNEKHNGKDYNFLPYFIADGEEATFYETNWALTGSLYKPNKEYLERYQNFSELVTLLEQHSVKTHKLDNIQEVSDLDLLKLDVQGAELKILKNATQKLSQAVVVETEVNFVPVYEGIPLFSEVEIFLRQQGFSFHTFKGFGTRALKPLMNNNNPNLGFKQLLWSNAVFIRSFEMMENLSPEKLKKTFLILHHCYKSYDFAYAILTQLAAVSDEDHRSSYQAVLDNKGNLEVIVPETKT